MCKTRVIDLIIRCSLNAIVFALLLTLLLVVLAPHRWDIDFRTVASGSMEPTIPVGSTVALAPVDPTHILPGDVISFPSPDNPALLVTHRVMEVTVLGPERAFRTQGDANDTPDRTLIPASKVVGREIFHIPYLGSLAQFVRTRQGWLLMVALPSAAIVLLELTRLLKLIWSSSPTGQRAAAAMLSGERGLPRHRDSIASLDQDPLPRATWIPCPQALSAQQSSLARRDTSGKSGPATKNRSRITSEYAAAGRRYRSAQFVASRPGEEI